MTDHDPSDVETECLLSGAASTDETSSLAGTLDRLRRTYGAEEPPPVGPMLSEFVDRNLIAEKGDLLVTAGSNADGPAVQAAGLPKRRDPTTTTHRRDNVLIKLSAFIGTLTGKILLGSTVAMAAVGGGQAAGVIDVVPDDGDQPAAEEVEIDQPESLEAVHDPDENEDGDDGSDDDADTDDGSSDDADGPDTSDDDGSVAADDADQPAEPESADPVGEPNLPAAPVPAADDGSDHDDQDDDGPDHDADDDDAHADDRDDSDHDDSDHDDSGHDDDDEDDEDDEDDDEDDEDDEDDDD